MKKYTHVVLTWLLLFCLTLSSCEAVEGIFKAGMWTAYVGIALVIILIIWLISKFRNK